MNLLLKAERALLIGDEDKASRFISRALAQPHDEYLDCTPAVWSVHFRLYMSVSAVLDDTDEEDDDEWLDACLRVASRALHERRAIDIPLTQEEGTLIAGRLNAVLCSFEVDKPLEESWKRRIDEARTWLPEPIERTMDLDPGWEPGHWIRTMLLAHLSFDQYFEDKYDELMSADS